MIPDRARTSFTARLEDLQLRRNSLVCIGLDPDVRHMPAQFGTTPSAVLSFNKAIIEATHDLVCAYKLNLAFYEALGYQGWSVLQQTLAAIPSSILTIGDGKRADIGNTSARYASALFDECGFDAVTVNPYMGFDSLEPFLEWSDQGVFVLVLTSNPGSRDFQRLKVGSLPLYQKVIRTARKWNSRRNIGFVVGATHPRELRTIRSLAPDVPILIPGVGKQGGDLTAAVRHGCNARGALALINVGRSVLYAARDESFASAARSEASRVHSEITAIRSRFFSPIRSAKR
jgi:orotidine-5'-phosphate decarboxylase